MQTLYESDLGTCINPASDVNLECGRNEEVAEAGSAQCDIVCDNWSKVAKNSEFSAFK